MKYYALLHGVCGLAEGYSDTTVRWFKTMDDAQHHKGELLASLMTLPHELVESSTDGTQDIITYIDRECEQEILKIIPYEPMFDSQSRREYLIWNQMDCEAPFEGEYLPSDMGVVKDLCERMESVDETFSVDALHEFIRDLWYNGNAMFDADDLCIYYFKIPKSKEFNNESK